MSTRLSRPSRRWAAASTFWRSATSSASTIAVPPKAVIFAATSSSMSVRRPMRATAAPSRANISAPALPIPVPAPVIHTTLPANALISPLLLSRGVEELAEQHPVLAVEAAELHLLDRKEVVRARVDPDAGQQHGESEAIDARRLLHDVGSRQVVAALLQYVHERLRHGVAVGVEGVLQGAARIVLPHELHPGLEARLVLPLRVGDVLQILGAQDALGGLDARRLEHGLHRRGDAGEDLYGLPAEVISLPDGLGRELRRGAVEKDVGPAVLQVDDLGVDGRIGHLVRLLHDDDPGGGIAEPVLEPLKVVLAGVVVL